MGGRDHSCEVCGRGGFNDPHGSCVCPVDPALEERVARALQQADYGDCSYEHLARAVLTVLNLPEGIASESRSLHGAKDSLGRADAPSGKTLPRARSDEVVVSFTREEAEALDMAADFRLMMRHKASATWPTENLFSARAKLSTALERE